MKNLKYFLSGLFLMSIAFGFSQTEDKQQAFMIYEQRVIPAKVKEYEQITKELISIIKGNGLSKPSWMAASTMDFRYLYVIPIERMADLDVNMWAGLIEKIGQQEFENHFDQFDDCITGFHPYTVSLDKRLSYMPKGWDISTPGENYRRWDYYYVKPENMEKAESTATMIRELFERKGSPFLYRVYRSGFGADGPYMLVVSSAKDSEDHARKISFNRELLGDEFLKLYNKFLSYSTTIKFDHGSLRPDLSNDMESISNVGEN